MSKRTKGPDDETVIEAVALVASAPMNMGHVYAPMFPHVYAHLGVLPSHITRAHIDEAIRRHVAEVRARWRRDGNVKVIPASVAFAPEPKPTTAPVDPPTPRYKGVPVVRIMAWMGAEGVSFDEAEIALDYLQILPDDPNELRVALASGARGRDAGNYPEIPEMLAAELVGVLFS